MSMKTWLIIAASLLLFGCGLFAVIMTTLRWDFTKLSTVQYETTTHEITEIFEKISMDTDTADVVFALSDDGRCRVECHEDKNAKHSVSVKDGTLTVKLQESQALYGLSKYIRLSFDHPKITVYLPNTEYTSLLIKESTGNIKIPEAFTFREADISLSTGDIDFCASASGTVKIKTTTGHIDAKNISTGALDLSVSTGQVAVSGVTCEGDVTISLSTGKASLKDLLCSSVISKGSTGDLSLEHVIATKEFSLRRTTGDVKFDRCDAPEIFVETGTGNVTGTLLSDKIFITRTGTGRIKVPHSTTGGTCSITTDTGDIKISVQ